MRYLGELSDREWVHRRTSNRYCTVLLVMLSCALCFWACSVSTCALSCLTFVVTTKFWRGLFPSGTHAYANGQFQSKWWFRPTKWKQDRYKRKLGNGQRMVILGRLGAKLWIYVGPFIVLPNSDSQPEKPGQQHSYVHVVDARVAGLWK